MFDFSRCYVPVPVFKVYPFLFYIFCRTHTAATKTTHMVTEKTKTQGKAAL